MENHHNRTTDVSEKELDLKFNIKPNPITFPTCSSNISTIILKYKSSNKPNNNYCNIM